MAKIKLTSSLSFADAFENFIFYKTAQGVTDKTIECYRSHFKSISNYLDTSIILPNLKKEDLQLMICHLEMPPIRRQRRHAGVSAILLKRFCRFIHRLREGSFLPCLLITGSHRRLEANR